MTFINLDLDGFNHWGINNEGDSYRFKNQASHKCFDEHDENCASYKNTVCYINKYISILENMLDTKKKLMDYAGYSSLEITKEEQRLKNLITDSFDKRVEITQIVEEIRNEFDKGVKKK